MAVRLRLMRMGKKKQPTYRVVAADSRSPRNGRFIEIIGTYQPRLEPSVVKIDNERAVHWLQNGAQPSETVEKLLKISGAWADFKGEQFVPPVPPAPKTKSSLKKSEPSAPVSESDDSDEAKSEEVEETPQDDEVAVAEDDDSTDDEADSVSDGDDEEQSGRTKKEPLPKRYFFTSSPSLSSIPIRWSLRSKRAIPGSALWLK